MFKKHNKYSNKLKAMREAKERKTWESGDCIYQWWIEQPDKPAEEETCMLAFEG